MKATLVGTLGTFVQSVLGSIRNQVSSTKKLALPLLHRAWGLVQIACGVLLKTTIAA